jgi:hypothetical protein
VNDSELVLLVDALEDRAETYLTLDEVAAVAQCDLGHAIDEHLLLVDFRTRDNGAPVTLCRLNRRHPLVRELTGW